MTNLYNQQQPGKYIGGQFVPYAKSSNMINTIGKYGAPIANGLNLVNGLKTGNYIQSGLSGAGLVNNLTGNKIPFIGGLGNIYSGIQQKNPFNIASGALSLLSPFLSSGAGTIASGASSIPSSFIGTGLAGGLISNSSPLVASGTTPVITGIGGALGSSAGGAGIGGAGGAGAASIEGAFPLNLTMNVGGAGVGGGTLAGGMLALTPYVLGYSLASLIANQLKAQDWKEYQDNQNKLTGLSNQITSNPIYNQALSGQYVDPATMNSFLNQMGELENQVMDISSDQLKYGNFRNPGVDVSTGNPYSNNPVFQSLYNAIGKAPRATVPTDIRQLLGMTDEQIGQLSQDQLSSILSGAPTNQQIEDIFKQVVDYSGKQNQYNQYNQQLQTYNQILNDPILQQYLNSQTPQGGNSLQNNMMNKLSGVNTNDLLKQLSSVYGNQDLNAMYKYAQAMQPAAQAYVDQWGSMFNQPFMDYMANAVNSTYKDANLQDVATRVLGENNTPAGYTSPYTTQELLRLYNLQANPPSLSQPVQANATINSGDNTMTQPFNLGATYFDTGAGSGGYNYTPDYLTQLIPLLQGYTQQTTIPGSVSSNNYNNNQNTNNNQSSATSFLNNMQYNPASINMVAKNNQMQPLFNYTPQQLQGIILLSQLLGGNNG